MKKILKFLWKYRVIIILIIALIIITLTAAKWFNNIKNIFQSDKDRKIQIEKKWEERNEEINNYNYDDFDGELDEFIKRREKNKSE